MIETGVYFGDIHSYYDLDLVLSSVDIPAAAPKTSYIEIAGRDGSLDLSEAHGAIKYNDRTLTFVLTAARAMTPSEWEEHRAVVCNALNGKRCKITLDKDDDYYYDGRLTVDSIAVTKRLRQITVSARVNPWKLKQTVTTIEADLTTDGRTVLLPNSRKPACPSIECTDNNTMLTFGGSTYALNAGTHKVLDLQLAEGTNIVTVSGTGTIKFTYQEGDM